MKRLSIIITLLLSAFLFACKGNKTGSQTDAVKSISLKFTELGRETIISIDCDKFEHYFPESRVKTLTKSTAIDSLMLILNNMKRSDDGYKPDVRGKIIITHSNNTIDTLCVGVKVLNYKNVIYQTPQDLLRFIQQ
jgi:hypothetical protein